MVQGMDNVSDPFPDSLMKWKRDILSSLHNLKLIECAIYSFF